MNPQLLTVILISVAQLILVILVYNLKMWFSRMANTLRHNVNMGEVDLTVRIARIVAQFRQNDESREAQDHFNNQTTAEVIKQVTSALESISMDKSRDVKIIISNDKINQEGFEIKLSYRLDDPV